MIDLVDYEHKLLVTLFEVRNKFNPFFGNNELFSVYQTYYNLVRDEQLIKYNVHSLGHIIGELGSKYEPLMKERVDRAFVYSIEELIKK